LSLAAVVQQAGAMGGGDSLAESLIATSSVRDPEVQLLEAAFFLQDAVAGAGVPRGHGRSFLV
jgi:hypothetical protein